MVCAVYSMLYVCILRSTYVNTTQDFSLKKKQLLSKLITKVATYTNFVALYDSFRTTTVISAEFVWL